MDISCLKRLSMILVFFGLTSCEMSGINSQIGLPGKSDGQQNDQSSTAPAEEHVDVSDAVPVWEAQTMSGTTWTTHVMNELAIYGTDMLDVIPEDSTDFCPNYVHLKLNERKIYWAYLISMMVKFESGFNTNSTYTESFNDNAGQPIVSRGLLQISIESSQGYNCGFRSESELHDPLKNLSCGIKILNRWVGNDGRFAGYINNKWQGGARYWSVLRAGDKTSYKSITESSKKLKMCL